MRRWRTTTFAALTANATASAAMSRSESIAKGTAILASAAARIQRLAERADRGRDLDVDREHRVADQCCQAPRAGNHGKRNGSEHQSVFDQVLTRLFAMKVLHKIEEPHILPP